MAKKEVKFALEVFLQKGDNGFLSPIERKIVCFLVAEKSYAEIGKKFSVEGGRIRQIASKAGKKLLKMQSETLAES
jgi:DNA-directed RNA polymerase sigma subunit (sigma70/sigma32)